MPDKLIKEIMESAPESLGPLGRTAWEKLTQGLSPSHLEIINESAAHGSPNSEAYMKVIVVSDAFKGLNTLKKHRAVQDCLKEELKGPIHALTIVAKTIEEWAKQNEAK